MPSDFALKLTVRQVKLHAKILRAIAEAVETGKPIAIYQKKIRIPPGKALWNIADWIERQIDEQNGGERVFTAWDYQEDK